MNKLTEKEYTSLIADALNEAYGDTLVEYDTDIDLAEAILKKLTEYLYFRGETAESKKAFMEWRRKRLEED